MKNDKVIRAIYTILIKQTNISIQQHLRFFVYSQLVKLEKIKDIDVIHLKRSIPINRFNYSFSSYPYSITYHCTIAFHLTNKSSYPPIVLAEEIFEWIENSYTLVKKEQKYIGHTLSSLYLKFILKLIEPGFLEFTLDDECLFSWLKNNYISQISTKQTIHNNELYNSLYIIQYAYMRCCNLIHLAQEQEIIVKANIEFSNSNDKEYTFVHDIESKELLLNSFAERQLISQIFIMLDSKTDEHKKNNIKQTLILSYYFLEFERSCRIFSYNKLEDIKKSQARLNLVAMVKDLLQQLYSNKI